MVYLLKMVIFHGKMLVHQRVYPINIPLNHYKIPLNHYKSNFFFPFNLPIVARISSHLLKNLQRRKPFSCLFAGADGGVEADAVALHARPL